MITAFSIDPITGFAMTEQPASFTVSKDFIITMDLPYSIKRNEIVSIPIYVFNNGDGDETATITMYNEDLEFAFIGADKQESKAKTSSKTLFVKANSGNSTFFDIRASKIGSQKIKVEAVPQSFDGDGIEQYLRVEPEGITEYVNEAFFIDLRGSEEFTKTLSIDISRPVDHSIKIEASVIGDILGLPIGNVNKLM